MRKRGQLNVYVWLPEYAEVRTHSPGLGKS
jgi:hypothetical protein